MLNTITRVVGTACVAFVFCAFIFGGARNNFINGTRASIQIKYRSTMVSLKSAANVRPGSGLLLTGDNGNLLEVTVEYSDGSIITLTTETIDRIRNSSQISDGVWWIAVHKIEYISGKEMRTRRKRLFGRW